MSTDANWLGINAGAITGFGGAEPGGGSGGVASGVDASVTSPSISGAPLYSPDNPLFWFGLFLLAAAGLIVVSTSVKAGPLRASAKA
jgi:hypothetical protein